MTFIKLVNIIVHYFLNNRLFSLTKKVFIFLKNPFWFFNVTNVSSSCSFNFVIFCLSKRSDFLKACNLSSLRNNIFILNNNKKNIPIIINNHSIKCIFSPTIYIVYHKSGIYPSKMFTSMHLAS